MTAATDFPGVSPDHTARKTPQATFDLVFRNASFAAALLVLVLLAGIMLSMVIGGWPAFREFGLGFITSSVCVASGTQSSPREISYKSLM